ncbi:hypothetical protein RB614_01335 [Phytohabitans sp. ZYX-F-186]|uniref:Uncharacterized protein n=1 Tax=Phytohabitans maris TaxID=3071409 RepID=A0ABU0Z7Y1_9ACTN|nr:hypothetical protein [Phytohabitans sp. ZYX-F-186]MDQ7903162.1 hypothetical protein [Phytohabitans sp. ZYX-F-186]
MAHGEAEHGSAESEQHYLLGEHGVPSRHLRWVCGAGPQPVEEAVPQVAPGAAGVASGAPMEASDAPVGELSPDEGRTLVPERRGPAVCRSSHPGWAGAHRHGAVRPRARATRRERPPDRWC